MKQPEAEIRPSKAAVAARAILTWLLVLAAYVVISNILCRAGEQQTPLFVMRTPGDWLNGVRISLTALLVSAMGAIFYRFQFTRPSILAIAAGLIIINIDPVILGFDQAYSALVEQVRSIVAMPPSVPHESRSSVEATYALVAFARNRLYLVCYMCYAFWVMVVLYSGYLGQYLASFALSRKHEERKESALYVAENAGMGLTASIAAGVAALVLASGLCAVIARDDTAPRAQWYFRPVLPTPAPEKTGPARPEAKTPPADRARVAAVRQVKAAASRQPLRPWMPSAESEPPEPGAPAEPANVSGVRKSITMSPAIASAKTAADLNVPDSPRLLGIIDREQERACLLVAALSFFVGAYIIGIVIRPRTSTWVACGAMAGVMALPLAALYLFVPTEGLESLLPVSGSDDIVLLAGRFYARRIDLWSGYFRLLELSPFTLASTAVISALGGDWLAKTITKRRIERQRLHVMRPL